MALTDAKDLTARAPPFRLPARAAGLARSEHGAAQRMAGTAFIIRVTGAVVDLPVADPAGALDGRRRVRHLCLCLDLAADGRRHRPSRLAAHRAAHHSRIHPAQRPRRAARLPDRQPLDRVCHRQPLVAVLGAFAVHALDAGARSRHRSCRSISPASRCRSTRSANMLDGLARSYNAVNIALLPPFVLRPLMLIAVMAAALCGRHRARRDHGDGGVRVRDLDDDAVPARPAQPLPGPAGAGRAEALRCQRDGSRRRCRSSRCGRSTCC